MAFGSPRNAFRPTGWVAALLDRITPQPDTFLCGVRWLGDDAGNASARWRYKRAWVDPFREGGAIRIRFSDKKTLHVRLESDPWWDGGGPAPRSGLVTLSGRSIEPAARVLLAVPHGHLCDFDVQAL